MMMRGGQAIGVKRSWRRAADIIGQWTAAVLRIMRVELDPTTISVIVIEIIVVIMADVIVDVIGIGVMSWTIGMVVTSVPKVVAEVIVIQTPLQLVNFMLLNDVLLH